jgi:hypothetical protein
MYSSHQSWTPVVNSAVEAYSAQDFELVQDLKNILFKALERDAEAGELDYVLVAGLDRIARCYTLDRKYDKAEEIQLKILNTQKTVLGASSTEILNTAMKLCNLAYAKSFNVPAYQKVEWRAAA